MTTIEPVPDEQAAVPTCYRHPKRETHVRCTRCDRYICPDCMRDAAVGHQCVTCVREGNKSIRAARTVFGGRVSATPAVTRTLIVLNLLAYLAELARPQLIDQFSGLGQGLERGGQYFVFNGGGYPGYHAVGIAHGEWYRLVTSAFLHLLPAQGVFGILHIAFNMWWLWTLGQVVEQVLGRIRFLALYLLSAIGGSVLGYLVAPTQGGVGASGAIFGLAAAYFIFARRLGRDTSGATRLLMTFVVWMVISAGFTSWEGHLGGLLAGGVLALAFAYAPRRHRAVLHAAATAGLLLLLVVLVVVKTSSLG